MVIDVCIYITLEKMLFRLFGRYLVYNDLKLLTMLTIQKVVQPKPYQPDRQSCSALANGLIEQATQVCVGLCVDGSTRALVVSQGTLSFPVINCTVRPGIERFDGAQMVKSSAVTLAASKMILVGGTSCSL